MILFKHRSFQKLLTVCLLWYLKVSEPFSNFLYIFAQISSGLCKYTNTYSLYLINWQLGFLHTKRQLSASDICVHARLGQPAAMIQRQCSLCTRFPKTCGATSRAAQTKSRKRLPAAQFQPNGKTAPTAISAPSPGPRKTRAGDRAMLLKPFTRTVITAAS